MENKELLVPISSVADKLGVVQRTLRIYDEEMILTPRRSGKNRRLYSMADIEKGKFIQYLTRDLGLNLAGIKIILEILEDGELNLEPKNYKTYIAKIAKNIGITSQMQAENREKLSKRGRKAVARV